MGFGKDQKEQNSSVAPTSGTIPSNRFETMLEQSYMTTAVYSVTVRDGNSNQSAVLQVAAISPESAKNRILEVAIERFGFSKPEITDIIKAY